MITWITITNIVIAGVLPLLIAWVVSVEKRIRGMQNLPDRKEMSEAIELHQKDIRVLQKELKEDIKRMEDKLDRMIDKLN